MNLRWPEITLRYAAAILLIGAAVIFFKGGFSFQSETQTSSDTYVISHTVILSHSAIFPAVGGVVLLAVSLFIRSKRA